MPASRWREFRAARAGIPCQFCVAGQDRLSGQNAPDVTSRGERAKRVLHDAVFQRMKGDHRQPGPGEQTPRRRAEEGRRDPRAPDSPKSSTPGRCASQDRCADNRGPAPPGARHRRARRSSPGARDSPPGDRARDSTRIALFAVLKDHVGEIGFIDSGMSSPRPSVPGCDPSMSNGSSRRKLNPRPS